MSGSKLKISLRGSLADDLSKQLQMSVVQPDLLRVVDDIIKANPEEFICIPEGEFIKIGRRSEVGQYPPDW